MKNENILYPTNKINKTTTETPMKIMRERDKNMLCTGTTNDCGRSRPLYKADRLACKQSSISCESIESENATS